MISFKTMWNDVNDLLSEEKNLDFEILEKYSSGFTVKEKEDTTFVTRDDFVDFWCEILYTNSVELEKVLGNRNSKQKYVYNVIRKLPYIREESGILSIVS